MDHEGRIVKLETQVESIHSDIARLYGAVERLSSAVDRLREHTDRGFADLRKEAGQNTRWLVGLILLNTSMIAGLSGRVFGLY